jgi:hypothetical protein
LRVLIEPLAHAGLKVRADVMPILDDGWLIDECLADGPVEILRRVQQFWIT